MSRPKLIDGYRGERSFADVGFPVAKCGLLTESNAGWRTVRPVLTREKCTFCLQCYLVCPDGALNKDSGRLEIDYDFCKGCGVCARECKFGALAMEPEEGRV